MQGKSISLVQTTDRNVNQLQQNIKQSLDPVLTNPISIGNIVQSVQLISGANTINHGLNQLLQGWWLTRKRSAANIYDNQANNPNPTKTLILVSDASVIVDVYCF